MTDSAARVILVSAAAITVLLTIVYMKFAVVTERAITLLVLTYPLRSLCLHLPGRRSPSKFPE
jgi:hypothetical protein